MKLRIKPYIKNLIKENLIFIFINLLLLLLIIGFLFYNFHKIPDNKIKSKMLTGEVQQLRNKSKIINLPIVQNKEDLDLTIKVLTNLIPNSEDFFSIIYSLEELSNKTNFKIVSYSVNLKNPNQNKVNLVISGLGDSTSFINFLKEYNYGGGRLITADKIELTPQILGETRLSINFYIKDVKDVKNTNFTLNENDLNKIYEIKNKINFTLKDFNDSGEEEKVNTEYPKKTNPF